MVLSATCSAIQSWDWGGYSDKFLNLDPRSVPFIHSQRGTWGRESGTVDTVVAVACTPPLVPDTGYCVLEKCRKIHTQTNECSV